MALKVYKPTTPGLRFRQSQVPEGITRDHPEKSLVKGRSFAAGRASSGRISVRRKGGGHKRRYRQIDFLRNKHDVPAVVAAVEYDPFRSANIALLHYKDGEKRYIIAPAKVAPGSTVMSGPNAPLTVGNHLPLKNIPLGAVVHNVEMRPGGGGQIVRSAGTSASVVVKDYPYVGLRLGSGENRLIHENCFATMGEVSNADHMNISLGKAGRARWLRRRPKVRGVAMNPVDHPHGGGEGKAAGGRHPVTPWGKSTKGYKTRNKRKNSSKFITKRKK